MATYAASPKPQGLSYVNKTLYAKAQPVGGTSGGTTRPASGQMYPRTK